MQSFIGISLSLSLRVGTVCRTRALKAIAHHSQMASESLMSLTAIEIINNSRRAWLVHTHTHRHTHKQTDNTCTTQLASLSLFLSSNCRFYCGTKGCHTHFSTRDRSRCPESLTPLEGLSSYSSSSRIDRVDRVDRRLSSHSLATPLFA